MMLQPLRTAAPEESIWKPITEDHFRKHVVQLLNITDQPVAPGATFSTFRGRATNANNKLGHQKNRVLSFELEQSLANDFAFLAATEEGARSVAACCVEENIVPKQMRLTVRLAGNDGVPAGVKEGIQGICSELQAELTGVTSPKETRTEVLNAVVRLDRKRIWARVDSLLGYLPSFLGARKKNPKATSLRQLATNIRTQSSNTVSNDLAAELDMLETQCENLRSTFPAQADALNDAAEIDALTELVKVCFDLSTDKGRLKLVDRLNAAGLSGDKWIRDKRISQIDKLGAYWRIPRSLTEEFSPSGPLRSFKEIVVETVNAYKAETNGQSKARKSVTYHVHVELQMVSHYLLKHVSSVQMPRMIGVSKDACFLCFLFLGYYNVFQIPQTHGKLHDQWTIPDLKAFSKKQKLTLRRVIEQMDRAILRLAGQQHARRPYAIQSRHNVTNLPLPSATASVTSVMPLPSIAKVLEQLPEVGQGRISTCGVSEKLLTERPDSINYDVAQGVCEQGSARMVKPELSPSRSCSETTGWTVLGNGLTRIRTEQSNGLELFAEVECPSKGRARVFEQRDNSIIPDASIVEVGSLVHGEEVSVAKVEDRRSIMIILHGLNGSVCQLELEWVE